MESSKIVKEELPVWDLSDIYKGISDPKLITDQELSIKKSDEFQQKYRGKINADISADQVLTMLKDYEELCLPIARAAQYTHLVFSTDSLTAEHGVLMQQANENFLKTRRNLIFFELDLMNLELAKLEQLASDSSLSNYKHFIELLVKAKPHVLSEESEQIFNDKSLTTGALVRLFDQNFSQKKFRIQVKGETKELPEEEILTLLQDPVREVRKAAAESLTEGLEQDLKMNALIYNTLVKDKAIGDDWHKHKYPEESRHLSNELDEKTVNTLVDAVTSNYGIVFEFYKFKKEIMGLEKLYIYDRYAPITTSDQKYSFEEARELVMGAFKNFSPKFSQIAASFFENKWIDAQTRNGKRGGAYCSYMTPDTHPVVFLNYNYKNTDVKTLAHELGHAINGVFMQKQTLINFETPLTLAETASVFSEFLLFEEMLKRIPDPKEKFDLYVDRIQSVFATVFRQISMYQFEQDVHHLQKTNGELTPDKLNELWTKRQKEMFGDSIEVEDKYANWWSYIPHFLHTPFYVYAYSFGELLVLALYARYKKEGQQFVDKYIEFMEGGSSASPDQLLKPFGIDLTDKTFWNEGLEYINQLVSEAKSLYRQIK